MAEAQTLLYAARVTNPGQVHIHGIKNSVPLATLPAWQSPDVLPVIRKALPQFVPGDNVLKTSLDNIGAIFHPAIRSVIQLASVMHGVDYWKEGRTVERLEKWILRRVGQDLLPHEVAWRTKVKFAAGSGLGDAMARMAGREITDSQFRRQCRVGDGITLRSKEELFYYRIFRQMFPQQELLPLIGRSRSV